MVPIVTSNRIKKEKVARLNIIISMIAFGTIGVFVKNISLSSAEISLWRGVFALITLFIFLIISKRLKELFKIKKNIWKLFISGAACLYATVVLFNKATSDIDGLIRTFIQFISAVIVLIPYLTYQVNKLLY